ncbi:ATP-binding protein [uncultured Helicobacter sp.]|uniref:ATP-binding protein n=1 Tax=uncultured Helicobacter sp. TaxID=175537 RepID=UPI00375254B4
MPLNALSSYTADRVILPRRYGIAHGKSFLYGPPRSGKTSLALQFALGFKKPIYIDLANRRLQSDEVQGYLLKMHLEKKVDVLVLDNYHTPIALPHIPNIVLIGQKEACPQDFVPKCILPLCFEEFVSFDTKNLSLKTLFNTFLKNGNLPEIQEFGAYKRLERLYEIICVAFGADTELFLALLGFQSQNTTPHRIYSQLKSTMKLSKDRIYSTLTHWQDNNVLFFLPHSYKPNAKKLYFADFSLSHLLHHNLAAQLENMLFLELLKLGEHGNEALCYGDAGEFIYQHQAFVSIPFATQDLIEHRVSKMQSEHIYVITLSFEGQGKVGKKHWKAINFIDFALGEE